MRFTTRAGALGLALAGLVACTPFSRESLEPVAIYLLDNGSAPPRAAEPGCHALMINNVRSAPGYGSTRIIYIREPHRLEYYAFHTWADSPASMLHPIFVRAAEQSGLFAMVVTPASPTQENLRLDMQLVSLKQRMDGDSSQVELHMRALLFGGDTLLGSRLFEFKEPAVSNPVAGVNAANAAVSKLTGALFEWIATVITAENPRCPPERS